jgi:alpha-1,2-mannosyltransferase
VKCTLRIFGGIRALIVILATGALGELFTLVITPPTTKNGSDFAVYYAAAHALLSHRDANIYLRSVVQAQPISCGTINSPFVYPPLFAILFTPFTVLPCIPSALVWNSLNIVFLLVSLVLLQNLWPQKTLHLIAWCVASIISLPLILVLGYGQINVLVLCGFVLALWCLRKGHPIAAGGVLGVISMIQVIPGLFLVYFLLQRQWKIVISMVVTGVLCVEIIVLVTGPQSLLEWVASNQSNYAHHATIWNGSFLVHVGAWFPLLVTGVYMVTLLRQRVDITRGYLWTIVTLFLLSPVVWIYFLIWLLPIWWYWWSTGRPWAAVYTYVLANFATYMLSYHMSTYFAVLVAIVLSAWLLLGYPINRATLPAWWRRRFAPTLEKA